MLSVDVGLCPSEDVQPLLEDLRVLGKQLVMLERRLSQRKR